MDQQTVFEIGSITKTFTGLLLAEMVLAGQRGHPIPMPRWSDARLEATLRRTRLRSDPGTSFSYSNLGFAVLGLTLSRVAGMPYPELIRERITLPLGMDDTFVGDAPSQHGRLARGHDAFGGVTSNWNLAAFSPAGAIRSTAGDMQRYLAAQLDPERTPLGEAICFAQQPRREFPTPARSRLPSQSETGRSAGVDLVAATGRRAPYVA